MIAKTIILSKYILILNDKKIYLYFLYFFYIFYFFVCFEILFLQAIVSWLAARQFTLLCSLLEQRLLLLRRKYPLIRRRA